MSWRALPAAQFIGKGEDRGADDAEATIAIVDQPVAGGAMQAGAAIGQQRGERRMLSAGAHAQGHCHISVAGEVAVAVIEYGTVYRPGFAGCASDDSVARGGIDRTFAGVHRFSGGGEAHADLVFALARAGPAINRGRWWHAGCSACGELTHR